MKRFVMKTIVTSVAIGLSQVACAGTDIFFNPLTQPAAVAQVPNHVNELNNPWQVPAGVSQVNLTSLKEIEADASQSIIRVPGLGASAAMFDMSAFDPTGRYVFIPHETQCGAGVSRYDMDTDRAVNLVAGDQAGCNTVADWSNDYGAFDPATWTPVNTLLVAEEWSGQGRIFEIVNPMADVEHGETVVMNELNSIPNVSHEGLRFNHDGSALYFVDEYASGSIYKFVPSKQGDYSKGQTFVLVVDAFAGNVAANASSDSSDRVGPAKWVAITDADGNALTTADPFDNATRGGRAAADEVGGTPYSRPEDAEVGYLKNGHEVLYFTATGYHKVFSVEELGDGKAFVRLAASNDTPRNLGYPATTAEMNDPDNLAQDALGNIYVIEDWPNSANFGGNVWFLRDTNTDGVAESLDQFLSLQVKGAEATGMIFRPNHPTQFIISVQHPESTGAANGMGDALWLMDLADVVPPPCADKDDDGYRRGGKHNVKTCSDSNDSNFVKKLIKAGK